MFFQLFQLFELLKKKKKETKNTKIKQVARAHAPTKSERGEGQREQGAKGEFAGWLVEVWAMVGGGGREVINRAAVMYQKVLVLKVSNKSLSIFLKHHRFCKMG